jgi:hypothetical protein
MTKSETINSLKYLFKKYEVNFSDFSNLSEDECIKCTKGIIAHLTLHSKSTLSNEDKRLIKEIYGQWC